MPSINLDISNRCTLECGRCMRQWWTHQGKKVPGRDMTMSEYVKIVSYFDSINFCGNVSDPVMNPEFTNFLKLNRDLNISTEVHNAATGRKLSWYQEAFDANPDARWIFGLDGKPEDSHKYRVNQSGQALYEAMVLAHDRGIDTTWRMITFSYNEADIEHCRAEALRLGIKYEQVISSRFYENDELKPQKNYILRDYETDITKVPGS